MAITVLLQSTGATLMNTAAKNTTTTSCGFWDKIHKFFLKIGYIRAASELRRAGYYKHAKNLEDAARQL